MRTRAQVLERDECERRGMGLYLAVASASDHPPKFIHLTYRAPGDAQPGASAPRRIALVGKALTFDTGAAGRCSGFRSGFRV